MNRTEAAVSLLQQEYARSWQPLENLLPHLEGYRYDFLDNNVFVNIVATNPPQAMAIYWRELLHRAHWAAASSLIRTHRWLCGLFDAWADSNLIVFSACARGLLESSCDTWYSLGPLAPTLAQYRQQVIVPALAGKLTVYRTATKIEDLLIHFNFARKGKKGETLPEQHQAQNISEYLQRFEPAHPNIREFYGRLCDIVHPGSASILSFAGAAEDEASRVTLTLQREPQVLAEMAAGLQELLPTLIATGFNLGAVTLRMLNAFPAQEVHTPFVDTIPIDHVPAWHRIQQLLAGPE